MCRLQNITLESVTEKCDRRTDRQTDDGQSYPYVSLCFAGDTKINLVIIIQIHSDKTCFQNVFVTLLRRVAKDVTSSALSWHKRYDFNAANFLRHSQ